MSRAVLVRTVAVLIFLAWANLSVRLHVPFAEVNAQRWSMPKNVNGQGAQSVRLRSSLGGNAKGVTSISFSPDGRVIAVGGEDGTIHLWNANTTNLGFTLSGNKGRVSESNLRFSPDGTLLAGFGLNDKEVRIWQVATGQLKTILRGHEARLRTVAFSGDGRSIVTGSYDKTAKLWDAQTGRLKTTLRDSSDKINVLALFSPDGERVLTRDCCRNINLWNTATYELVANIKHDHSIYSDTPFSPDGRFVATSSEEPSSDPSVINRLKSPPNFVYLWDSKTGRLIYKFTGHKDDIFDLTFSQNGKLLASASRDGTVKLWNTETGEMEYSFKGDRQICRRVMFSGDNRTLAAAFFDSVTLYEVSTRRMKATLPTHQDNVEISFSADGHFLATTSDKKVEVWSVDSGELIANLANARSPIAFSPKGDMLATGSRDNITLLWEISSP